MLWLVAIFLIIILLSSIWDNFFRRKAELRRHKEILNNISNIHKVIRPPSNYEKNILKAGILRFKFRGNGPSNEFAYIFLIYIFYIIFIIFVNIYSVQNNNLDGFLISLVNILIFLWIIIKYILPNNIARYLDLRSPVFEIIGEPVFIPYLNIQDGYFVMDKITIEPNINGEYYYKLLNMKKGVLVRIEYSPHSKIIWKLDVVEKKKS